MSLFDISPALRNNVSVAASFLLIYPCVVVNEESETPAKK
jgi:hypothetical protein